MVIEKSFVHYDTCHALKKLCRYVPTENVYPISWKCTFINILSLKLHQLYLKFRSMVSLIIQIVKEKKKNG